MKTLAKYVRHAQSNVFESKLRPTDLTKLKTRLRDIIDQNQDDVRFYPLCDNCLGKVTLLGKAELHRRQDYVVI
ncbi:MAG: CRISPR-associated endonuclease Cas2 [Caldilineaceae bacterium]